MTESLRLWLPVLLAMQLMACGGEPVALNERAFSASGELVSAGCYLFELGGDQSSSSGAAIAGGLTTNVGLQGDDVVVAVKEGDQVVAQKRYGKTFFDSGKADEFTAVSISGSSSMLLRYWGRSNPGGLAGCAPLTELRPSR